MRGELGVLAEAFRYPTRDHLAYLEQQSTRLPSGQVRSALELFANQVAALSLGQWEELYTRTLELNPAAPPYIGHVIWGENYSRSGFLAVLSHAMCREGIDLDGELPDHLVPVLRYLDRAPQPVLELMDVLDRALGSIHEALAKSDPDNPYVGLLAAAMGTCALYLEEMHACK